MLHKSSLEVLLSCVDVVDVDVVWMYCNADIIIVISWRCFIYSYLWMWISPLLFECCLYVGNVQMARSNWCCELAPCVIRSRSDIVTGCEIVSSIFLCYVIYFQTVVGPHFSGVWTTLLLLWTLCLMMFRVYIYMLNFRCDGIWSYWKDCFEINSNLSYLYLWMKCDIPFVMKTLIDF